MNETKDQTIARLTAERDALSARLTEDIKTYDEALTRKTAELAASREMGPCGKHPKMFSMLVEGEHHEPQLGKYDRKVVCTLCAELAVTRANVIEKAVKGYRYLESDTEYKKRLEALNVPAPAVRENALREIEESYDEANALRAAEETAGNVVKHAHATGIMSGINIVRSILLRNITQTDAATLAERDRRIRLDAFQDAVIEIRNVREILGPNITGATVDFVIEKVITALRASVPAEGEK